MAKNRNTFNKRKREQEKKERADEKRQRKQQRKTDAPTTPSQPVFVVPEQYE
ncbi:MAG: hypothetical protein ACK5Q5_09595 [Planctomycetaceae bacterium]